MDGKNTGKWEGIGAMEQEGYALPKQAFEKIMNATKDYWQKGAVLVVLTLVFSLSDAMVLYSVMDAALTQAAWMSICASFIIALILNFIPICISQCVHHAVHHTKKHMSLITFLLLVAFGSIFCFTLWLRFSFRDIYGGLETLQLANTLVDNANTMQTDSVREVRATATVMLLSFAPLATSIVNFVMSFLTFNPVEKQANALKLRTIELEEAIGEVTAGISTMENIERDLIDQENAAYESMRRNLIERAQFLRAFGIQLLEEYIGGNPSAISKLSVEAMPEEIVFEQAVRELQTHVSKRQNSNIKQYPFPSESRSEEDNTLDKVV